MILPVRNILVFAGLIVALSVSALGPLVVNGQKAIQPVATRPFEPSEELFYEAEFSRALLRKLDVADFRFSASRTPLTGQTLNLNSQTEARPYALTSKAHFPSKHFFTYLFIFKFPTPV